MTLHKDLQEVLDTHNWKNTKLRERHRVAVEKVDKKLKEYERMKKHERMQT